MGILLHMPLIGSTQDLIKKLDKGTGAMSFSRACAATYIGSNGLVSSAASGELREEWGPDTNQRLRYSEDFYQSAWDKLNMLILKEGVTAPNGKGTAQTLTAMSAGALCMQSVTDQVSRARHGSIYLKRKTGSGPVYITLDGGSTWTVVALSSSTWTRVSKTQTVSHPIFGINVNVSGDAVYAFGAQLGDGSTATRYRKTGASALVMLGVLIEGERTNQSLYSENFDYGWWYKGNGSITATNILAPDGASTGCEFTSSGTDGFVRAGQTNCTIDTPYVWSVWLRVPTGTLTVKLYIVNQTGVSRAITDVKLTTVWQRVSLAATPLAGDTQIAGQVGGGNSIGNGQIVHLWGGQLELAGASSCESSYIHTLDAGVTRAADVLTVPSSSNIQGAEGSAFAMFGVPNDSGIFAPFADRDNNAQIIVANAGKMQIYDGYEALNDASSAFGHKLRRACSRWGTNVKSIVRDGGTVANGYFDGSMGQSADLQIGALQNADHQYKSVKHICVWDRMLSDTEMNKALEVR